MYTDPTETTERDFENEINTLENRVYRLNSEKYFLKKALNEVVAILTDEQKEQVKQTLESIKYY